MRNKKDNEHQYKATTSNKDNEKLKKKLLKDYERCNIFNKQT
jgi:hypothetical protein